MSVNCFTGSASVWVLVSFDMTCIPATIQHWWTRRVKARTCNIQRVIQFVSCQFTHWNLFCFVRQTCTKVIHMISKIYEYTFSHTNLNHIFFYMFLNTLHNRALFTRWGRTFHFSRFNSNESQSTTKLNTWRFWWFYTRIRSLSHSLSEREEKSEKNIRLNFVDERTHNTSSI